MSGIDRAGLGCGAALVVGVLILAVVPAALSDLGRAGGELAPHALTWVFVLGCLFVGWRWLRGRGRRGGRGR